MGSPVINKIIFVSLVLLGGARTAFSATLDYQALAKCCEKDFVDAVVITQKWGELEKAKSTRQDQVFWNSIFTDPRIPSSRAIDLMMVNPVGNEWQLQSLKSFLKTHAPEALLVATNDQVPLERLLDLAALINRNSSSEIRDEEMHSLRESLMNSAQFHRALFEATMSCPVSSCATARQIDNDRVTRGLAVYHAWRKSFDKSHRFIDRHIAALGASWDSFLVPFIKQGGAELLTTPFPAVGLLAPDQAQARISAVAGYLASPVDNKNLGRDLDLVLQNLGAYYLSRDDIPALVREILQDGVLNRLDSLPPTILEQLTSYVRREPEAFFKTIAISASWEVLSKVIDQRNPNKIDLPTLARLRDMAATHEAAPLTSLRELDNLVRTAAASDAANSKLVTLAPSQTRQVAIKLANSLRNYRYPHARIHDIQAIRMSPSDYQISPEDLPLIYEAALQDGKIDGLRGYDDYMLFAPLFPEAFFDWAVRTESWSPLQTGLRAIAEKVSADKQQLKDFCKTAAESRDAPFWVYDIFRRTGACKTTDFDTSSWTHERVEALQGKFAGTYPWPMTEDHVLEALLHWVPSEKLSEVGDLVEKIFESTLKRWDDLKAMRSLPTNLQWRQDAIGLQVGYSEMLTRLVLAVNGSPFASHLKKSSFRKVFYEALQTRLGDGIPIGLNWRITQLRQATEILNRDLGLEALIRETAISQARTNEFRLVNSLAEEYQRYGITRSNACDILGACLKEAPLKETPKSLIKDLLAE